MAPTDLAASRVPLADGRLAPWELYEPVVGTARHLLDQGYMDGQALEAVDREVTAEVEAAVAFARESPLPEASAAFEDVFA